MPGVALVWGAALGLLARNPICTVPPANPASGGAGNGEDLLLSPDLQVLQRPCPGLQHLGVTQVTSGLIAPLSCYGNSSVAGRSLQLQ